MWMVNFQCNILIRWAYVSEFLHNMRGHLCVPSKLLLWLLLLRIIYVGSKNMISATEHVSYWDVTQRDFYGLI